MDLKNKYNNIIYVRLLSSILGLLFIILNYFILHYLWLFMVIILMAIVGQFIDDYWCLYISLMTIGLVTIVGYSIGNYWWLFEAKLPQVTNDYWWNYFINGYWWL